MWGPFPDLAHWPQLRRAALLRVVVWVVSPVPLGTSRPMGPISVTYLAPEAVTGMPPGLSRSSGCRHWPLALLGLPQFLTSYSS